MLRVAILIFISACLITQHAGASLGKTKAQLDARYGPSIAELPAAPGEENLKYRLRDLMVVITLVHGKSEMEVYAPLDAKTPLSSSEIESLLKANSFGKHWVKSTDGRMWFLGGSNPRPLIALAAYFPKSPGMIAPGLGIMTARYAKQLGINSAPLTTR